MSVNFETTTVVAGSETGSQSCIGVFNPYNNEHVGSVPSLDAKVIIKTIDYANGYKADLKRSERFDILMLAKDLLMQRKHEFARLITLESGLCLHDTLHEVERACDVLLFSAQQALGDDGAVIPCDVTASRNNRVIYTKREPLSGAIVAITPFNHPLNQVVHKVAPAIASNNRIIVKPSEKTPLTAILFAKLLYEAGLPSHMFQVVTAKADVFADIVMNHEGVDLISFTGSSSVGKAISKAAGYKRLVLELGGNDPLIVCNDADLKIAAALAASGSFANSGQRCTAVKRILVDSKVKSEFIELFKIEAMKFKSGDPMDESTRVGCVIDRQSAQRIFDRIDSAIAGGAKLILGGECSGALIQPTIISNVSASMALVANETFGPTAPVMEFSSLEEAISISNSTRFGLSAGVVTNNLNYISKFVNELEVGTVNFNEVPGYRTESSPFGGIKDSGLGYKEGVVEAYKGYTNIKTYSLPWERNY
ncbi:phosphonoacetaldehyde dehydrogenase [Pseudomonas antarctica]|uniref:phosphonoacetaldehyde dehydrogenase n=1 Tax=Pseudomonas antarctica TaxID=219572 RepID=UPI00387AA7A0